MNEELTQHRARSIVLKLLDLYSDLFNSISKSFDRLVGRNADIVTGDICCRCFKSILCKFDGDAEVPNEFSSVLKFADVTL